MSIHTSIHHVTHYKYDRAIRLSPQIVRLRPAPHCKIPIRSYSLNIEPDGHFINWMQDPYGNYMARIIFPEPVRELKIEVEVLADVRVINPFDFFLEEYANQWPFEYSEDLKRDLKSYRDVEEHGPLFQKYLSEISRTANPTVDFLVALNTKLQQHIKYLIRMEPGVQTPEETLTLQSGSCRDTAWLLIHILRHLGFGARFVSGYLIQLKADEKPLVGPAGTDTDFTDLHAWAEVYLPGAGWIGLDPTSGLLAGEGHIPVACTPHYRSAAPIEGFAEPAETEFNFKMDIRRVWERPRVTAPVDDEQWAEINRIGAQLDKDIQENDIRLTVGGEPTFVSLDHPEKPEWNTSAVGEEKRVKSAALLREMSNRMAKGHLLHYGQGKWYPGESLPRWAMGCYWRKDGSPLWRNHGLMANLETDYGLKKEDANRFIKVLSEVMELNPKHIFPAFEDTWYYLWKEKQLPDNVTPTDSRLKDPEERERLARIFNKGLDEPSGFVLPMQKLWQAKAKRWVSANWKLRRKNMFLIPGDSPLGLRLPLSSLPWISPNSYPHVVPHDPMRGTTLSEGEGAERSYKKYLELVEQIAGGESEIPDELKPQQQEVGDDSDEPEYDSNGDRVVRTALCVEVREGKLFVFMPPVSEFEDYADLVSALEVTALKLNMPIILEGESPPYDPAIESFKITPDPGVVEVNIHPATSCVEFSKRMESLYDAARTCHLGTDKFLIDGKRVSTGGGHHIVMGGSTPADSPFLRRPDLLKSLLTYWLSHPSLSYLFAGLHIGPTSQSPRIDEARHDSIYELEIAFKCLDSANNVQPWLVDRIFRNLLTDTTGNTHRAEFCIDKLYNPELTTGRLGLLELRSFEMSPHPRMCIALHYLIISLVIKFWKEPLATRSLARWATALHDKWMLPYFLQKDLADIVADLKESGYQFDADFFKAHVEFRFPIAGTLRYHEIEMELRSALEPWHVLGESGLAGGTVRYVDSSLERLQVQVKHFDDSRYSVLCNGIEVPLVSTGVNGEFVAGVRFRAWQPPECLHPTIPVDSPLVFDLYDKQAGRVVSGCTYHVMHPGGRSFDEPPVNDFEAEGRKLARFETIGHTIGNKLDPIPAINHPQFPYTLDMRLHAVCEVAKRR